jgi:hypothetical protein
MGQVSSVHERNDGLGEFLEREAAAEPTWPYFLYLGALCAKTAEALTRGDSPEQLQAELDAIYAELQEYVNGKDVSNFRTQAEALIQQAVTKVLPLDELEPALRALVAATVR